ncbi:MAG TPA: type II toxin-antitoxin system ParD family antitoxin [Blastocatellia bacterium]|jgi:antitoxin ParD1/3/4
MSMNIPLTPELERLVNDEINTGDYKSASEVVREGLRLVRLRREKLAALKRELQIGIDDIENGRYGEYSSVEELFDDIEAEVAKRAARKPKSTQ